MSIGMLNSISFTNYCSTHLFQIHRKAFDIVITVTFVHWMKVLLKDIISHNLPIVSNNQH